MEAIKYYVKGAFQGVKLTPEVLEQQEELIADLTAKVADLISEGKSEEEALGSAMASMGDLSALVSEFEADETVPAPVSEITVLGTQLDFHTVAISAAIGAAVMIASVALGLIVDWLDASAGLMLLLLLAAGIWWVRTSWIRYEGSPGLVEARLLDHTARFRKAVLVWVGVSFVTFVLNASLGDGFWCWTFWVAGGTWALTVKIEKWLLRGEKFLAPELESDAA